MRHAGQSGQALVGALVTVVIVFAVAGGLVTAASALLNQQRFALTPVTEDIRSLSEVNAAAAAVAANPTPWQCPAGSLGAGGELGSAACARVPLVASVAPGAAILSPSGSCAVAALNTSGHLSVWVNAPGGGSLYVDGSPAGCGGGSPVCTGGAYPAAGAPLLLVRDCDVSGLGGGYAHVAGSTATAVRFARAASFVPGPGSPLTVNGMVTAIATGRFHAAADGIVDLAVAVTGSSTAILIFRGIGNGGFQFCTALPADNPNAIVVGDFDGDTRDDLAFTNPSENSVSVMRGSGDCQFQAQPGSPFRVGAGPSALAALSLRPRPGPADLAVANHDDGTVTVLLNDGTGELTASSYPVGGPGSGPAAIVGGQFVGSPGPDLFVADSGIGVLALLRNKADGTGTFGTATYSIVGGSPSSLVSGDFDRDGALDVAVANGNFQLPVLLGAGRSWQRTVFASLPAPGLAVTGGRFSGGANLDLAVRLGPPSNSVLPLLGNGDGTFQAAVGGPIQASGPVPAAAIAAGAFDGDPSQQGVVTGGSGWLAASIHNRAAVFSFVLAGTQRPAATDADFYTNGLGGVELRFEGLL